MHYVDVLISAKCVSFVHFIQIIFFFSIWYILQTEELRGRLEERNKVIEKKTQTVLQANQERNRISNELNELRDHMDIKDRKISVLQRKVRNKIFS